MIFSQAFTSMRIFLTSIPKHLSMNVSRRHADFVLLLCYTITGLLDASATAIWGAFVSMQTGNTVYLGLGLSHPTGSSTRWIKSGTSIASFCLGSFLFARFHRLFGQTKRWVLVMSFMFQLILIIAAALIVLVVPSEKNSDEINWTTLTPLAMIAFQSSGQAVTSRALKYGALSSVVLTSIYCDLFSDAQLFAGCTENVERNRRVAAPVLLLFGAMIGGAWSVSQVGLVGALWTAAGLKAFIAFMWLVWPAESSAEEPLRSGGTQARNGKDMPSTSS